MANFIWASKRPLDDLATLYESNITLNKSASSYFEHAYVVLLGLDKEKKLIAVKPVTKDELALGYIPEDQQHNITLKSSYSRICNKMFMKEIGELIKLSFANNVSYKFKCHWDKAQKSLIIDLNDREV
ncbi:MAG: hypothetical protein U1C51_02915 [Candidatus Izemoplasmatales bacterium]|jgi:hypothetical protein|nr:hypothetical protein [bacterium]MDZ4196183.1 hypothetical protein [Candidatus Izemoplasmatales bacterium]